MLILVERDEFLRALGPVSGVPSTKADVPILTHLVISTGREGGTVRGTDTQMEITSPFKATVSEPGSICVPARLLHDIVKRMPAGREITLTQVESRLRVVCGKSRFEIGALPAEDYPAFGLGDADRQWKFEVEADRLRSMLVGVRHAISKEETRYYLNGVHLHVTAEEPVRLKAVATTGHVLAVQSCTAPVGSYGMPPIIVPRETVAELVKVLPDGGQLVTLTVSQRFIWLDIPGGLTLGSKLIDGEFPDYERIIPRDHPHRFTVEADALIGVIDRVGTLCDASYTCIGFGLSAKGPMTVSAERAGIGSASDQVEAVVEGQKRRIGVNYRYLLNALQSYAGGTVEVQYEGAADPLVMTIAGSDLGLQVIMPMRLGSASQVDEQLEEAA